MELPKYLFMDVNSTLKLPWLLVLCLLAVSSSWAVDPTRKISQYVHNTWDSNTGLPQNTIRTVLQTRDGYLWIGTEEGLVRFNGTDFTLFNKSNTDALKNDEIRFLFEDTEGSLWIVSNIRGLARYRNGQFHSYGANEGFSDHAVSTIVQDNDNKGLWIGTIGEGLFRYADGQFQA